MAVILQHVQHTNVTHTWHTHDTTLQLRARVIAYTSLLISCLTGGVRWWWCVLQKYFCKETVSRIEAKPKFQCLTDCRQQLFFFLSNTLYHSIPASCTLSRFHLAPQMTKAGIVVLFTFLLKLTKSLLTSLFVCSFAFFGFLVKTAITHTRKQMC